MTQPYDPYFPHNQRAENQKTQHVQQQVDEVVGIMQENIDKTMKRGVKLDGLQRQTEDLQATSGQFRRGANQVRKNMWLKDLKWKIVIVVVILVVLGLIIGSIVGSQQHNSS